MRPSPRPRQFSSMSSLAFPLSSWGFSACLVILSGDLRPIQPHFLFFVFWLKNDWEAGWRGGIVLRIVWRHVWMTRISHSSRRRKRAREARSLLLLLLPLERLESCGDVSHFRRVLFFKNNPCHDQLVSQRVKFEIDPCWIVGVHSEHTDIYTHR